MRALWEWIINPLLPDFVIAAIKSSRCKPDTGLTYRRKVKWITLGALPAFILRIRWTQAAGCMEAWPQNPQCMDTDNSCYHPGTSSKAMPSLCHTCEQFLRIYQTFLPLLLHLILRKSLWIWHLLTILQMRISNHMVVNSFDQGHTTS